MKNQFFTPSTTALKSELKKAQAKYMAALDRGGGMAELAPFKQRIIFLHTQLNRADNEYCP